MTFDVGEEVPEDVEVDACQYSGDGGEGSTGPPSFADPATCVDEEAGVDEIIEKLRRNPDLEEHEQRLLGCIIDGVVEVVSSNLPMYCS